VRFNVEALLALRAGDEAHLTLPDGEDQVFLAERSIDHGGGITTWIARSERNGSNERAVITHGPAGTFGWIRTRYGEYRLYPGSGGVDWLAKRPARRHGAIDTRPAPADTHADRLLPHMPTFVEPHDRPKLFAMPKSTPAPATQGDVLVLYTPDLAKKLGTSTMPMIYNLIDSANQAYIDSEIAFRLRLVYAAKVDLPVGTDINEALYAMTNSSFNGSLDALFGPLSWQAGSLRDQVGADFVALLRPNYGSSEDGVSYLLHNPVIYPDATVTESDAVSVVDECDTGCEVTFAHELGHDMGNGHDRATTAYGTGGTIPTSGAAAGVFPYSYGHYDCTNGLTCDPFTPGDCNDFPVCKDTVVGDFGTIMSYFEPTVMKFANPDYPTVGCVAPGASAPGRACGVADQDDTARSMNNVRAAVSAYRSETIAAVPGSVQFKFVAYTGHEGGDVTFTASRTGGNAGAISVDYSIAALNSTAGTDYPATSGTLTWADGDTADKSFSVPITSDGQPEGVETFRATLSNPRGALGAFVGYPDSADGLILETWPTNAALPAGWTTPAGSSTPWVVVNDTSGDGDGTSLASGVMDFSHLACAGDPTYAGSAPCPSKIQADVTLNGGEVQFMYRVSSFPSLGFFELLVDGAVYFSDSGRDPDADTGWQYTTIAVPAGHHILTWQFRPELNAPCNSVTIKGLHYPACQDRAWIDDVSLPLALGPSATTLTSSSNPSIAGAGVTFTATVSGASGPPTGTVSFQDAGTPISGCEAVALASALATCRFNPTAAGTFTLRAVYSGSTTYAPSTSSDLVQQVSAAQAALTASSASLDFGGQSMDTTSPPLSVVFTNGSALTVSGVAAAVSGPYAIVSDTCSGAVLASGSQCSLSATFTPTAEGNASGSLTVSYAGGTPAVVGLAGVGQRSLVTHYYRSILQRAPDSGGYDFWQGEAARVAGLGANVNEVWFAMSMSFFGSAEYRGFGRNDAGYVTDLYNTFYNRAPDPGGFDYWMSQLAGGMPREALLVQFLFSPEFASFTQAIFGNTAVRPEMDMTMDMYRGILQRLPDSAGFTYFLGQFRAAQCSGPDAVRNEANLVSQQFFGSPEYAGLNRTNAQFMSDIYNAIMRRGADLDGIEFWIGQLDSGALTREQVRQEFVRSTEFNARVTNVINAGCTK
jgi:hypothetical protein